MTSITRGAVLTKSKVAVSLRLPRGVVEAIECYAHDSGLSKTDAYLHFLETGLQNGNEASDSSKLDAIHSKLDRLIQLVGNTSDDVYAHICEAIRLAAADYPAVAQAYLFGSFARGDYSDQSDVDVRLVLNRDIPFNLRDLDRFAQQIERRIGRNVDVLTARTIKNKSLHDAFERDKVLVYDRKA